MLRLDVNEINGRYLVEAVVTDWDRFSDVVINQKCNSYSHNGVGLNLRDIYDEKDTLRWVNEEGVVKMLIETVKAFNEEYGEDEFELLAVEHFELSEKILQLQELKEKSPLIEAQLFYMRGYADCLAKRMNSLQIKEEE